MKPRTAEPAPASPAGPATPATPAGPRPADTPPAEAQTQAIPRIPPSDDTVILPALRGRTTAQDREHPPAHEQPRDEEPPPVVPPHDPERPARRGPSRAMIGVGVAVVLVIAAAVLLVSLPSSAPGSTDWAGDSSRNWPPAPPTHDPGTGTPSPASPQASMPFAPPAPGEIVDNGLLPGAPARSPSPGSSATPAQPQIVPGTPTSPPSTAPTSVSPTTPNPLTGGDGSGQIEAESFAWQWGVLSTALDGASGGRAASGIANGDWLRFDKVNVGSAKTLQVRIANGSGASGRMEIRYDSPWASPAATVTVDNTGGWAQWRTRSVSCGATSGTRTVYVSFVSRGNGDFVYLDWLSFS
ncbi:carbohydrate-binding protein [Catenuloplanes japonicus]|uniref:carbohydrate-binding protein n=1 Tax=Catenuloplanes japonicus TaxID=33876 RepID=UPI0012F836FC|nr:carbohydrate-binding protein [Catenuloplanes japonicus]